MKLAINEATTMPRSFEEDVAAYSAAGFQAIELWLDKVKKFLANHSVKDAQKLLSDNGLKAVGGCAHGGVMLSRGEQRETNLADLRAKLEICQALDAPVLVVCTDFPQGNVGPEDYDHAAQGLAGAADIAAPYKVALAVEFIKGAKLVGTLRTALNVTRKTGKKNVGILFDTFHFYAGVSKLEDIAEMKKGELLLVHLNDMAPIPIEIAQDRDRVLPGNGVLPLKEIIKAISRTGYDGYYSVELFSEALWQKDPKETARLALEKSKAVLKA